MINMTTFEQCLLLADGNTNNPWQMAVRYALWDTVEQFVNGQTPLVEVSNVIDEKLNKIIMSEEFEMAVEEWFDSLADVRMLH